LGFQPEERCPKWMPDSMRSWTSVFAMINDPFLSQRHRRRSDRDRALQGQIKIRGCGSELLYYADTPGTDHAGSEV
jgi:hypothetical protein